MKTKSVTKRVLSVILCTVMLFSCWVFSAPTAVAQNAGNYDVRVTINVTGTNNIKEAYQGFESAKGDSAGVTIRCLKDNGVSTTTTDLNWDIGNGKTGNSYIKSTGNHTLTGTAAGFPAYIYLYLCDNYVGSGVSYQVTKLEVKGTSQTSYTTLWSGTMKVTSKTNGYGGWLRYDGHVKGFDHGLKNADEGSKGDNNNYINTADKKGWLAKFPYRSSGGAVSASDITLDGTNSKTSAVSVGDAKDQYSVNYATSNLDHTAMSTPSYNSSYITYSGDSGNPARTVTATKNAHIWDDGINSQNVSVTAYWKTRNTTNTINNTTTAKTITITDEKYTYTWNWKETNTSSLDSPSDKSTTLSPYYGDTPSIPTAATATTAYYTSSKHWSGGSYTSPARASAAKSYTMTYSVDGKAHSYTYAEISGNHSKHKGTCSCGYSPAANFDHDYDTTTFTFADNGKTATATRVCKTNGCKHEQSQSVTCTSAVKTAATCLEKGWTTYTATSPFGDGATGTKDVQDIDASGHDFELTAVKPNDKVSGYTCYHCKNCDNYWNAPYDSGYTEPDLDSETGIADPGQLNNSDTIPAPYFNDFKEDYDGDGNVDYAYGERGSGLKLMKNVGEFNAATTKQDFRFSGSVAIPKDISYEIGSRNDNVIKDFGFVYSQDSHIWNVNEGKADTDQLVLDSEDLKIASMSVVNNNAANGNVIAVNDSTGRLTGENGEWTGVTFHPGDGSDEFPDSLTFNLVISIKATNWKMQYAARPYITYTYHGETYTVYDNAANVTEDNQDGYFEYSCCSVYSLASYIAVLNPNNSAAKYCTDNILAHEALLYPTRFTADQKSDEFTDWWKWVEGDTSWSDFINPDRENSFYSAYSKFMKQ